MGDFCSSEWASFNVGWPRDGTFNLDIISQVKTWVFDIELHGHPDQVAYIVTWESLAYDPPSWVKPFVISDKPQPPLTPTAPKASLPPGSQPLTPLPPSSAPTTSSLYPALLKEKPKPATPPILPPNPDSPLIDLLSEEPPPYVESQEGPEAAAVGGLPAQSSPAPLPMAGRLQGRREPPPDSTSLPLREGPNGQQQYWSFSASDLHNWKQHNPPFSKDPVVLTNLIESILVTHQPTWDNCQQLFLEAGKNVPGDNGRPTQLPNKIDTAFPLTRPDWDFTMAAGRGHLRLYHQLLIAGFRGVGGAACRPTNLAQVKQVIQGKEETPSAFLERLKEAYRMYTPYDPEDPGQATSVSMSFIWQFSPDIRSKLQRLEGLQGYTLQDLLKEAEKIFNKRETPEEKEERLWQRMKEAQEERDKKRNKELSKVLATIVHGQNREGDRLGDRKGAKKDQCAYCKERGHWVKDCPMRSRGPRRPKPQTSLLTLKD